MKRPFLCPKCKAMMYEDYHACERCGREVSMDEKVKLIRMAKKNGWIMLIFLAVVVTTLLYLIF